jgi:hypothetical protein
MANSAATAKYGDQECPATARPATHAERDEVWQRSTGIYGGYDKYQERITGRTIRIFVLDPA